MVKKRSQSKSNVRNECYYCIWVITSTLPADVTMLLCSVTPSSKGHKGYVAFSRDFSGTHNFRIVMMENNVKLDLKKR